jgi:transketolase
MTQVQDQTAINVLKGLVIDGINKSQSGHPGGPLSSMDLTYLLFTEFLRFDPDDPKWMGRDRFILSAGHMSMLQYAMLYGVGWLTIEDLKNFRQLHSKTPGHPENFMTPGVECTTGPLGQGAAMSVGFSVAASHCAAKLDKKLFGYKTWTVVSDGDLQEGVALGAASLAGHLKLGNLVWIYDKNFIQLSGPTNKTTSDDEVQIYGGFGWQVLTIDGHDHAAIRQAYKKAKETSDRPTLIVARTVIGKGLATMEDSHKTHGSPLPADERTKSKAKLGLPGGSDFYAPDDVIKHFRRNFETLRAEVKAWKQAFSKKLETDQDFSSNFKSYFEVPADKFAKLSAVEWSDGKPVATRNAFGDIIEKWAHEVPNLIGGSADLEPSNMTGAFAKKVGDFNSENRTGRNLNFGVREFPMSAICNGMALHGGLVPFDATFLSFADYSRGALRLGAIQKVRVIHEFTHDSFYLGEDGPTHQPIEQVMALRAIPDFYVMRPADAVETEVLMRHALGMTQPSAFCLSRQKLPQIKMPRTALAQAAKGAYAVLEEENPTMLLIATGSEVALALDVAATLVKQGERVRVVSMPCWELFAEQPSSYRLALLPPTCTKRVTIEAGTTLGWERFAGDRGLIIGINHYGASAPAEVLAEQYGFTPAAICAKIAKHQFTI